MKSQEELLEFALAFFDARKFVNNFSVHVRLAQTIEFELFLSKPEISLKMALLEVVEISLLSLPTFEAIQAKFKKEETDAVLSLIGELYNIEWISDNNIFEVFEKFFKEDFADAEKLRYLRSLLLIVSVKLIKNCVGERFEVFSRALRKIRENFIGINDQLTCNEVLEIFETFEKFSNQQPIPRENASVDCKEIEPLLKNLNVRNFSDVARKLQALSFVCDNEIIEFAKTFIKSMLDSQQTEEKFAKLAANVENEKFQQFLVNELQHIFLDSFVSGSVSEEKTLKLIVFIAELFNLEIISNDCINLILDVLFGNEKTCNKTADYICIFITIAGLKLDEKNKSKTDRYFAFLKFVVESEEGKSYRSKVYKELIEKRTVKKTQENFVEKEISAIWKTISQDHEQIENYALLCREISMRSNSDFGDNLLNFVASQPCEPQNVNKVLFIAELFKYELLTDEFLGRWINLDQIKKLPSIIVTRIINSIANNPNTSLNVQTTALLMNLEEIVADDSEKVCEALKRDLKELAQMMEGQKQVETS